jgi:hypothetical protein
MWRLVEDVLQRNRRVDAGEQELQATETATPATSTAAVTA